MEANGDSVSVVFKRQMDRYVVFGFFLFFSVDTCFSVSLCVFVVCWL